MQVLATICHDVINGGCRGGTTLSLLHDKTFSLVGEAASQDLCLYLTQAACVPYFGMLEKWLYKGLLIVQFHSDETERSDVAVLSKSYVICKS